MAKRQRQTRFQICEGVEIILDAHNASIKADGHQVYYGSVWEAVGSKTLFHALLRRQRGGDLTAFVNACEAARDEVQKLHDAIKRFYEDAQD